MLLHLLFKDAPRVLNRVQVWRHTWPLHYLHFQLLQEGSGHLGGVLGVVIMMEKMLCVPVSEGGHHVQNATTHVGIHDSFNELQSPSAGSIEAAPNHDATANGLDCRQGKLVNVLFNRLLPHIPYTIYSKIVSYSIQTCFQEFNLLYCISSANSFQAFF